MLKLELVVCSGRKYCLLRLTTVYSFAACLVSADTIKPTRTLVESDDVTVFAWVKLPVASSDIQTVVSNRVAGCAAAQKRYGFAMHVNNWDITDRKLRV
jgi:hypothetical protein